MDPDNILIPAALCGTHREVRRPWAAIVRRAVKARSWEGAIAGGDMVSLKDAPGGLVLDGPATLGGERHVMLYAVVKEVFEQSFGDLPFERYDEAMDLSATLLLDSMPQPWFCLAALGYTPCWMIVTEHYAPLRRAVAAVAIEQILTMWPTFVQLDDRFRSGIGTLAKWPYWGKRALIVCQDLGVPHDEYSRVWTGVFTGSISPDEAATRMHDWLAKCRLSMS